MPLVLNAQNNVNYGGNLINQKYSPLQNIQLNVADQADYRQLFTARIQVLTAFNAYPPNTINFYANWPAVVAAQVPMVVISSNRADWMQVILQNAMDHVANAGPFTGYLDATTFNDGTVPWYAPLRSGNRPLYVVVHWSEYDYYHDRVGGFANVTVVGYKFTVAHPVLDIVGFGASRYAALQLMIDLGYQRAWAVDDNVVNVNGFPNTLATIEAHMPVAPAPPAIWGISFNGATTNINEGGLYDGTVTFAANPDAFGTTQPGLLQQVVLWNLDLLRAANLNFCPLFVASNEDISLSNFLQASNRDERIITAFRTVKIEPQGDPNTNRGASTEVPRRRNRLLHFFNDIEAEIPINPGGGQVPLSQFVNATILPQAHQPQSAALATQSRAIEQVMAAATLRGWYSATAFNPYNGPANVARLLPAAL